MPTNLSADCQRLSSPEQLDRLVTITDARGWLSLASIALLLVALLVWSFSGVIPTNIRAQGILMTRDGKLADAVTPSVGMLETIFVKLDQQVEKGQVVAQINQDGIQQRLINHQEVLNELEAELNQYQVSSGREMVLKKSSYSKRRESVKAIIIAYEQRESYAAKMIDSISAKGQQEFISRNKMEEMHSKLSDIRNDISTAKNELLNLDAEEFELNARTERETLKKQQFINNTKRKIRETNLLLQQHSKIVAPIAGRVSEFKLSEGAIATRGQAVLSIESSGEGLQALIFIPSTHGKKVKINMPVRIEPATIRKEEYGSLLGKIEKVSDFPITRQGLSALISNETLVEGYLKQGSPYSAFVELLLDDNSSSGFRWTSGIGPPQKISSGTTVQVEITTREQRPITLAIPFLKKILSMH